VHHRPAFAREEHRPQNAKQDIEGNFVRFAAAGPLPNDRPLPVEARQTDLEVVTLDGNPSLVREDPGTAFSEPFGLGAFMAQGNFDCVISRNPGGGGNGKTTVASRQARQEVGRALEMDLADDATNRKKD
jgi:hypothetical protein